MLTIHTSDVGTERDIISTMIGYVVGIMSNDEDIAEWDGTDAYWLLGTEMTSAGLVYSLTEHDDDDHAVPTNRKRTTYTVHDHTLVVH